VSDTDPFTLGYHAVRDALIVQPEIAAAIRDKNLIDLTAADARPFKDQHGTRDVPELAILPGGLALSPHFSSSTVQAVLSLSVVVLHGDLRLHLAVYPILWAVAKAVVRLSGLIPSALPVPVAGLQALTVAGVTTDRVEIEDLDGWTNVATVALTYRWGKAELV